MKLRRLNEKGLDRLSDFLDSLTTDQSFEYPSHVLSKSEYSESVESEIELDNKKIFHTKDDAGDYLYSKLKGSAIPGIERDRGIWGWVSLFYFEQLCPPDSDGKRRPNEKARWIPAVSNDRKYYRHLLAGPYRIYQAHRDDPTRARVVLCTPVDEVSELYEQIVSNQKLVTNKGFMEAATRLYVDASMGTPKTGAGGKGPGSARRLVKLMNQLDLTWDLYSASAEDILRMLPDEFDRFKKPVST